MNSNPLLHRLIKEKKEDVVHTSAYAQAQNAGGMGAAATVSFEKRMEIEKQRKLVRKYGDSRVANRHRHEAWRARQVVHRAGEGETVAGKSASGVVGKTTVARRGASGAIGKNAAVARGNVSGAMGKTAAIKPPVRRNPGVLR